MTVDTPASDRELVRTPLIDAPREKLFRAWTEPELLKHWFTPAPYTTPVAELDVRPGGGHERLLGGFPGLGVRIGKNQALVFDDIQIDPSVGEFVALGIAHDNQVGGDRELRE